VKIKIYVVNLASYNRGELRGKWLTLPKESNAELWGEISEILGNLDEEIAIHDYEAPFEINEYENIEELNERIKELEDVDEDEEIIEAIINELLGDRYDWDTIIRILKDHEYVVVEDVYTYQDLATKCPEEYLPVQIPEDFPYIDWEALGRDMVLGYGWRIIEGKGLAINILE